MLFVSLVLSFANHTYPYIFSLSIGSFNYSRRGSWRGIWNYCMLIFLSRLQFGPVAVKHDSSIAAFAMADGFDPSGLSWDWNGAHSSVFHAITQTRAGNLVAHAMGCWLHGSSQSGFWQASEQTMKSQSPFTWKKNLPKASKDKGGLWSSQTLASGGRWLFGCFGSACPRSEEGCFGPASDSAPACEVFSNFDLKWGCFGLSGSCFSQALAASGKLLPAVKAALACFDAVPTSHFEAALHT